MSHSLLQLQKWFESDRIHTAALIVGDYTERHSHWSATKSLSDWLAEYNIPAIQGKAAINKSYIFCAEKIQKVQGSEENKIQDEKKHFKPVCYCMTGGTSLVILHNAGYHGHI